MKPRTALIIFMIICGLMLAAVIAIISNGEGRPVFVTPTSQAANTCSTKNDLGCGVPNAACASSRVGKYFIYKGIKYTCKGPKPYTWRR